MKPTHAAVFMDGSEITLPAGRGSVHYEGELVLRVGKPYEQGIPVDQLVDGLALGIDFTLRDVQSELKKKGHPWLAAKGFPGSAALTSFRPFPGENALAAVPFFCLVRNGEEAQKGTVTEMIFSLQQVVDFIAAHFGLGEGDIIYTGTPAGVAAVQNGDHFLLKLGEDTLGDCAVKLSV